MLTCLPLIWRTKRAHKLPDTATAATKHTIETHATSDIEKSVSRTFSQSRASAVAKKYATKSTTPQASNFRIVLRVFFDTRFYYSKYYLASLLALFLYLHNLY